MSIRPFQERITKTFRIAPDKDVLDRLTESGFDPSTIDALVLSHQHFDHIGDIGALPKGVDVICGPGTLEKISPGYPADQASPWRGKWLEARDFFELPPTCETRSWDGAIAVCVSPVVVERKWQHLACFDHAVDWFGDGSLWIVDTPGVRVQLSPSAFKTDWLSHVAALYRAYQCARSSHVQS